MTDYISISEIPHVEKRWPWNEWLQIPPGTAVEITNILNGQPSKNACASISTSIKYKGLHGKIRTIKRGDRVWVANIEETT